MAGPLTVTTMATTPLITGGGERMQETTIKNSTWDSYDGVDLNRNFDLGWGVGASTSPSNIEYQGPTSFSEPETSLSQLR